MKKYLVFAIVFLLISINNTTYSQTPAINFTSVTLQPTIAYVKYKGETRRMARLLFKNGKSYAAADVSVTFNNHTDHLSIPANKNGLDVFELPLPGDAIKISTQAIVTLKAGNQTYTARCIVEPARANWSVYVLPHSHVDIGYTNTQAKVLKLHMENIDESIALAEKTQNYPAEARFKWTTEAIWVVDNYLKLSSTEKKAHFWNAVKKGWINLDGAYGNINTSLTDSRQLMQMFAESQRLAREQGIEIHTMFQGDVPGASWGLAAQAEQTGIRYFLSGPNASDRIGNLAKWQDKPFYWVSPSGKEKLLFWQCQPYSIGYALKGTKIPNFFTIDEPKPFYTGKPTENFLNPYLFQYLGDLEQKGFPYDMSILTWAMSDNAPIDPELPDAVKAWNEHFESPKLIITSTKQFFTDLEKKYKDKLPSYQGDYTEYWTDGVSSSAKETAINRNASDVLKQSDAIWAIRNKATYPVNAFNDTWKNLLLFNEHTWGAYNSTDAPDDAKVKSEWAVKQSFALSAHKKADSLMVLASKPASAKANTIDVYNTQMWPRTDVVYVPAALSKAGDAVKNASGKRVPSQRLSTGELAILADDVAQMGKSTFTISAGKAYSKAKAIVTLNTLSNGVYNVVLDKANGNIQKLVKGTRNYVSDTASLNQYIYLPGDTLKNLQSSSNARISIKEKGPLVVSLLVTSDAPGTNGLTREIRLVSGLDKVELINTIDKKAIRRKESVHFAFPFNVPNAQVRYSIPWGSIAAEADQLPNANHNWYTQQRWVDVSNANYGVTWSSPDAPLFEIGKITTDNLLGGLHFAPQWLSFTPQSSGIYSWVMNNLWHTNFKADQDGVATFRYFIQAHEQGYNSLKANQQGLNNHQPLIVAAATANEQGLPFKITGNNIYTEILKPADDGKGTIVMIVNTSDAESTVNFTPQQTTGIKLWDSNLAEDKRAALDNTFTMPGKGIKTIRIETK
ncbi:MULTISPECIES: glycoside hydrolase family 38 C-terminal domain-containing protein [unclassified Mucilaginibacter]|uniref:glycoside hydrolase family 38 N-terminal domain-containing protein n=1 Tax=unclassified Mucilaginibacter TaxID=2617802 RepID=UPI002AC9B303|nr:MULTISPECIES: glycoside hydrolase family 38 C-terminal domain-containing protein [unclassified Mucilaginibacter]MEB0248768.1 glycoside hydrolase family 38 C-terminal domain-containing protein [Mucilaginibacter sp. 5B2]MEB0263408.1 glycoside hydrolase family 38 C-terminal domain-containing protein [Mucilaginibacter sp. 10I4]MEB0280118.1 glycoside hydrolase family 38 C-terminal domain-containing protein [Mucilaginibacter sp. 10B2]MEB0301046.1 glycoside hydrolase family 38 C-terminal domain-con